MNDTLKVARPQLTTPRAAAIAGIVFSLLLITSLVLIRLSVPQSPEDAGEWLVTGSRAVALALNLLPFAGIAFLWFIGVVRDRLGDREDRFFATVFLGSGLLFLALLFSSAAVAGSIIQIYGGYPDIPTEYGLYAYSRTLTYEMLNVYAAKMAGVFMISTSTLSLRTGIVPRWVTYLGFVLALFLLLSVGFFSWAPVVFPLWVLLVSIHLYVHQFSDQEIEQAMEGLNIRARS